MRIEGFRATLGGLVLASALMATGESAAQSFFTSFTGAPSSIACTNTDITLAAGANVNWNLPSPSTQLHVVETVGATVALDLVVPLPVLAASGTFALTGTVGPSFTSTPFPYTFTLSVTPVVPGATTSSFSFVCASATGTNFTIVNGGPFSTAIPTLSEWGLFLLAMLLAASGIVLFRRGFARK